MSSRDFDNTNRGALFKNDKTGGNPNWPDYRGKINVNGQEYWLDAWIKDGKKGKFMSLSIKPKEQKSAAPAQQKEAAPAGDFGDSEIPF